MRNSIWLESFGQIDHDAPFYVFAIMTGLTLILCLLNIFIGCCAKGMKPGSSMDFYIAIGSVLVELCVLIQGINTGWVDVYGYPWTLGPLCQIYPTCLLLGLTMFIGGIMVKSWAIFSFYKWNTSKKSAINEEWKPNVWIWLLIIIMGVCVVVWTATFESKLDYIEHEMGRAVYQCSWENTFEWLTATMVWHGLLLVVAFVAIFANCCVGSEARKQSSSTSLVTFNTVAVVAAGVVLYFLTHTEETITYGINGALAVWMCFFANLIIFLYKAASVCCGCKKSEVEEGIGDENYDTIKSDNSDIVASDMVAPTNQTFSNNGYEPSTENFNY